MDRSLRPPDYTFDAARLAALDGFGILDTPAEPGFDSIVELAAQICETPVALVSLVSHNRQWFKARIGFEACETDLNSSVCAFALVEPDLLIVPDLSKDPRTRANPLVTGEPGIRFYAGAPLRTAGGGVVGSLCVIDGVPRPQGLTPQQAAGLRNLGRQVMAQLELRSAIADRDAAIASRQLAEAKQDILNKELSHRMKNTFAMVHAIATQTLRKIPEKQPVTAFLDRLHALSTAHDVLLQQSWTAADIGAVVRGTIDTLSQADRFDTSGPPVNLSDRATLSIALLLHELTVNALKHGSLSNDSGRVRINWTVSGAGDDGELALHWRESGGPPVQEPTHKGFGSRLIQLGFGTGTSELRYRPSGFEAEFEAPLAQVLSSRGSGSTT